MRPGTDRKRIIWLKTICLIFNILALQPVLTAAAAEETKVGEGASSPSPVQKEANPEAIISGPANMQKIEIVFGGSLCPVCLVAFERRLIGTPGVESAKVDSILTKNSEHSGHPPKRAHAIIGFDPGKITKFELETMVRQNDFQFIKTQEPVATKQ